ncbi:Csp1 family four helix bundle copper storage protein [Oligoflexus tunisiensis]|uniref:Csp1 family four helix bundle copper storage protein n=1 Tax=Oligoflexus tunisiensis TaxID=708132 RepID=UPI00114CC7AB|nr:Csp1 family four helix bundle copper storage protein [Oligoflexus tunisiensis]
MNRRDMIMQAASSVGTLAIGLSMASSTQAAGKAQAAEAKFAKLADASNKCVTTGLTCINHCQKELAQGNKMMADCLNSVLELVAACESLEKLARYDSAYTKEFAKVTAKICSDCAKICEKHAGHMESCKACMEACKDCEKACLAA